MKENPQAGCFMERAPFVAGVSYRTARLDQLEYCAVSHDQMAAFENEIRPQGCDACVVLSTCNRTEVYGLSPDPKRTAHAMQQAMLRVFDDRGVAGICSANIYALAGEDAIRHLFGVVAGLDSMILGETEIACQVQRAFDSCTQTQPPHADFTRLFAAAYRAGKRVRAETTISEGATSVASAAVHLAQKMTGDLKTCRVLLLGAGETGTLLHAHLKDRCGQLWIANRTMARARELAQSGPAQAIAISQMNGVMDQVDVVFCAVSAPAPLIDPEMIGDRTTKPLLFVDISLPHAVAPEASLLPGVDLCNMSAIKAIVSRSIERRVEQLPVCQAIIEEEMQLFLDEQRLLSAGPLIRELRDAFEHARTAELARHASGLSDAERQRLDQITRGMMNRILHHPTVKIREWTRNGDEDARQLVWAADLFGLTPPKRSGS